MNGLLSLFLALVLLSGCAMAQQNATETAANTYSLYFAADPNLTLGGDAVAVQHTVVENSQELDVQTLAETMVRRLLEGPEANSTLSSPFPKGTMLLSLTLDGPRATVDLSASYGTLSGIQLTLADYCITLTLTQLTGISVVSITVQGEELAYRNSQSFRARDVLLTSTEDVVGTLDVTLWFADGAGTLTPESRVLKLYEGDTQTEALMAALVAGPETKGLVSALPEGFSVLSVWTEEDICYVNLPSALLESPTVNDAPRIVRVLVDSLCSLESISGVQIRVDGESRTMFGSVPIGGILQPKN